jgi:hypothetical protein
MQSMGAREQATCKCKKLTYTDSNPGHSQDSIYKSDVLTAKLSSPGIGPNTFDMSIHAWALPEKVGFETPL